MADSLLELRRNHQLAIEYKAEQCIIYHQARISSSFCVQKDCRGIDSTAHVTPNVPMADMRFDSFILKLVYNFPDKIYFSFQLDRLLIVSYKLLRWES